MGTTVAAVHRSRVALTVGTAALAVAAVAAVAVAAIVTIDDAATVSEQAERLDAIRIGGDPEPTARYTVTLDVTWGSATHPTTRPPGSHTSPPVAIAHAEPGDLFRTGTGASAGIETMAEVGSTSTLVAELSADATVESVQTGRRIDGPGVDTFEFDVDQQHRFISLVTMLAPSPDWFIGVDSIELFADDLWAPRIEVELGSYDAGTDSGSNFISPNANTSPAQPIAGPRDAAFAGAAAEGPFARLIIERIG